MAEHLATPLHWRKSVSVVAAIIRRDNEVLVVRNVGGDGLRDRWSLPGGSVHNGELLTEAVVREVSEETGLAVHELGPLVVYSEHYIPAFVDSMTMVAFEVAAWSGDIRFADDPDNDVSECTFLECSDAADLIENSSSFGPVWQPVVAYLRGKPPRSWFWRIHEDGSGGDTPLTAL